MSDDIVTRLREQAQKHTPFMPRTHLSEAADEIERLRAENDGLRIRIYTLLNKLEEQEVRGE